MATQRGEASEQTTSTPVTGQMELVQERYQKVKEHSKTYPYVWASHTLVYGGLAPCTAYRWRKLRKTQNRVPAFQERLRKLVENEESANSANKTPK